MYNIQALQILTVLATEVAVRPPNPVPTRNVFGTGCKEDHGIIGLHV